VIRRFAAAAAASMTGCSIWAALDDPYKSDEAPEVSFDAGRDATIDAPAEAAPPATTRIVDAGFVPYAIAAHADTVYVVDNRARVHVAYDAGSKFTTFWAGDGGDTFLPTNHIAASAERVCWTVADGVRYCEADGGDCGRLPSTSAPTLIVANDPVVAWVDNAGVRVCTTPLATCSPTTVAGSKGALSLAAGPNGNVAWTTGTETIHVAKGQTTSAINMSPFQVSLVATEGTSDDLYWEGQYAVGFVHFDGTGGMVSPLASGSKPTQLFAARGLVFWSLLSGSPPTSVSYCRLDTTTTCVPHDLSTGVGGRTTDFGIAANSRDVYAIINSLDDAFPSELLMWRLAQ
jgi:hypothetical protein